MKEKHYKSMLSAFVNHELGKTEHEEIGRHLMQCADCRGEHDRVKLGSTLAGSLSQADAPRRVWNNIEAELDQASQPRMTLIPDVSYFGRRNVASYAVGLILVMTAVSVAYLALFRPATDTAKIESPVPSITMPEVTMTPVEVPANVDQANVVVPNSAGNSQTPGPEIASAASWKFEAISGSPTVGDASSSDRLAVGDFLETDAASRAKITVANIGNVEIKPNSRVKLVGTKSTEHRLSLERGQLHAKILAPPRLFIVDTPSAVAVDLGCEYTLDVDNAGNSKLHVTSGFVALERGTRESIVPAGAMCLTMKGKGLGTPFSAETSTAFRTALERFDFANGGSRAVRAMLASRGFYDMISLWHLLSRVKAGERASVFDALAEYVKPPAEVTRDGIVKLDKSMLAAWRGEVERVWFE